MKIDLLASRPVDIDIPGDIYYGDLPPRPRMLGPNATQAVNADIASGAFDDLIQRGFKIMPGASGIMHKHASLMGISKDEAVWRMGFLKDSPSAQAFGCSITETDDDYGFLWVLATRRAGTARETYRGWALNMPDNFKKVIESPLIVSDPGGHMSIPQCYSRRSHAVILTGNGRVKA